MLFLTKCVLDVFDNIEKILSDPEKTIPKLYEKILKRTNQTQKWSRETTEFYHSPKVLDKEAFVDFKDWKRKKKGNKTKDKLK